MARRLLSKQHVLHSVQYGGPVDQPEGRAEGALNEPAPQTSPKRQRRYPLLPNREGDTSEPEASARVSVAVVTAVAGDGHPLPLDSVSPA